MDFVAWQEQEHALFSVWLASLLKLSFISSTWWGCGEVGKNLGGWEAHTHIHTHLHTLSAHSPVFLAFAAHPTHHCPVLLHAFRSVIHPCGALTFRFLSASHSHTAALSLWSTLSGVERVSFQRTHKVVSQGLFHEKTHFHDVWWCYRLNMKILLMGPCLIFWSVHSFNIISCQTVIKPPRTLIKRTNFVNIVGKGSTTPTAVYHRLLWGRIHQPVTEYE